MSRSIRGRLQAWYAAVLLAVVAGFAGLLYAQTRAARLQEIDAGLEAAALYLDGQLRRFPPHDLDGLPPPGKKAPPPWEERKPPPPQRARLLAELTPPDAGAAQYYAVWRDNGSVLKADQLPADAEPPPHDTRGTCNYPTERPSGRDGRP